MDTGGNFAQATLQAQFEQMREAFLRDGHVAYQTRYDRLKRLENAVKEFAPRLNQAMSDDFGYRSAIENENFDITIPIGEIRLMRHKLRKWMERRRVSVPKHLFPARAQIIPQPLGVIGIIAPWNFPVSMCLMPMAAALAAGNRVMLKPSELAPKTAQTMVEMLERAFPKGEVRAVTGDSEVSAAFSSLPFNHLFFTGSTTVGQKVYEAAAKNLTPVTLELGGKSPAIITGSADIDQAARRILWGKLANAGQICVAPDYVLLPSSQLQSFIDALQAHASTFYPEGSSDLNYTSIINDKQFARLKGLLDEAKASGADVRELNVAIDPQKMRQFQPHIVINPARDLGLMRDEIFGPILPIITYESEEEALALINGRAHPLALYIFAQERAQRDFWLERTTAGGVSVNDVIMHVACDTLPFGGVGKSGIGAYHGQTGFDRFSHLKPVFIQSKWNGAFLFEPPFPSWKKMMLKMLQKII